MRVEHDVIEFEIPMYEAGLVKFLDGFEDGFEDKEDKVEMCLSISFLGGCEYLFGEILGVPGVVFHNQKPVVLLIDDVLAK